MTGGLAHRTGGRLACCLLVLLTPAAHAEIAADWVLSNGHIITVDDDATIASAIAVYDGKIVAVGDDEVILAFAGPGTRRLDLRGHTVTPGLIDSHNHFSYGALLTEFSLDLSYPNVESIADVQDVLRETARDRAAGDWITGERWDAGKFVELRDITAADLDEITPDNPVWLTHTSAHYGTANSAALERAGVTADTPDPEGGRIERYADGTPTGVLKDTAVDLVLSHVPDYTQEQFRIAIASQLVDLHKSGITAYKDPEVDERIWRAYQQVLQDGELTARVFTLWRAYHDVEDVDRVIGLIGPFSRPYVSTGDDRLISGGIKIYVDGSGTARTAWMHEDWNVDFDDVDVGNKGLPRADPAVIREQIAHIHDAGLHVGVHAIGDAAIDLAVDAFAAALQDNPRAGLRHSIIHCNVPSDHALGTIAELQRGFDTAYPEIQPPFVWWIGDTYAGNFGPDRSLRVNPLKTYKDMGIRWGAGSDFDVTPFPPRYGLWASLARETLMGVHGKFAFGREETTDIQTALRSYTAWNARQLFLEEKIGSLEVGKYADLVVWNRNMYSIPPAELTELESLLTMVEGEIVYQATDSGRGY